MGERPLVSVVINNYNYGRFLRDAIESALNQTYPNVEVIVVDDGSTDNSRDVIEEYALQGKVVPIYKQNEGQASAFNRGIEMARGTWIAFLDSDDLFYPKKVEEVVNAFSQFSEAGWLVHPLVWLFPNGEKCLSVVYSETRLYDFRQVIQTTGRLNFHFSATSGLVFSKSVLERLFPVPHNLRITADNYLKFAAARMAPVVALAKPLAFQRIHGNNIYTFKENVPLKVEIHLEIMRNLKERFTGMESFLFRLGSRQVSLALSRKLFGKALLAAQKTSLLTGYPVAFVLARGLALVPKVLWEESKSKRCDPYPGE